MAEENTAGPKKIYEHMRALKAEVDTLQSLA